MPYWSCHKGIIKEICIFVNIQGVLSFVFVNLSCYNGHEVRIVEISFGKRLKRFREIRELNQDELAEKCHVSTSCISRWETDTLEPNYKNIIALSQALKIEIVELFPISEDRLPQSFMIREAVTVMEQLTGPEQEFFLETLIRYQKMRGSASGSPIIS